MNKHDIELLEAAAKAAGATDTHQWSDKFAASFKGGLGLQKWNPLDDDGDAFRLAVKLAIAVCPDHEVVEAGTDYMFLSISGTMWKLKSRLSMAFRW